VEKRRGKTVRKGPLPACGKKRRGEGENDKSPREKGVEKNAPTRHRKKGWRKKGGGGGPTTTRKGRGGKKRGQRKNKNLTVPFHRSGSVVMVENCLKMGIAIKEPGTLEISLLFGGEWERDFGARGEGWEKGGASGERNWNSFNFHLPCQEVCCPEGKNEFARGKRGERLGGLSSVLEGEKDLLYEDGGESFETGASCGGERGYKTSDLLCIAGRKGGKKGLKIFHGRRRAVSSVCREKEKQVPSLEGKG